MDKLVKLWDLATFKPLRSITASAHALENIVFSPDGKAVATVGCDGYANVWNSTDLSIMNYHHVTSPHRPLRPVYDLAFSADGARIVTGDVAGLIRVWDRSSFALRSEFGGEQQHTADIQSVAFLAGDRMIVSAGGYAILKLWDAATGKCLGTLLGHTDKIWGVSVSPDGSTIATASSDGTVKLWDPQPPRFAHVVPILGLRDAMTPTSFSYSPDGQALIFAQGVKGKASSPVGGRPGYVVDAELDVKMFDLNTGTRTFHRILAEGVSTYGASLSPEGTLVVFTFPDLTAATWQVATGKRLNTFERVVSLGWAGENRLIITRPSEPLDIVNAITGRREQSLEGSDGAIILAVSRQGEKIVGRRHDQLVIWDVAANRVSRKRLVHEPDYVVSLVSPDSTLLAIGDSSGAIQLRDIKTLDLMATLLGHSEGISRLCFSPDARTLVSSSGDGSAKLWDVEAREELLTLPEPFKRTSGLHFAPDGRTLVVWVEGQRSVLLLPTARPGERDSDLDR